MKAITRVTFLDDQGEKFFGEGPARILHAIEEYGSLRTAAMSMNMAYTKAFKLLKNAETALGFPLTARVTGGRDGGGSMLTPAGKLWLDRYEAYRDACMQANRELIHRYFPVIGCVIMASGLGRRFGGNKLMADFDGKPMVLRALEVTEGLAGRRVVVTRHEDVARLGREHGLDVVLHDLPHRSDTVRLGLEAVGETDGCMFLSADQPLLCRETVADLIRYWEKDRERICRPVCGDKAGTPVLFPKWAFPELMVLPEGKGGNRVMENHPDRVAALQIEDPYELMDVDTPEDLKRLQQRSVRRWRT